MSTTTSHQARGAVAGSLWFRARRRAAATALIVVALAGCDSGPKPPVAQVLPKGDTPEVKLERVITRLKFALRLAESAGNFGVVSKRQSRYRFIPASDKESRPTAEVTVHTTVTLSGATGQQPAVAAGEKQETSPPVEPTREKEVILLVYDNDKWQMPSKPASETLEICFESALRDE